VLVHVQVISAKRVLNMTVFNAEMTNGFEVSVPLTVVFKY